MNGLAVIIAFACTTQASADAVLESLPKSFQVGLDANLQPIPGLEHLARKPETEAPMAADLKPFRLPAETKLAEAAERAAEAPKPLKKFPGLKEAMKRKAEKVAEALAKNTGIKAPPELEKAAGQNAEEGTHAELFTALSRAVVKRISEFNAQNLAITAWSFARAGRTDPELFDSMAREAERRVDEFTAQDITYTTWAFETAGRKDPSLYAALARVAEQRMSQFKAADLVNTAWSFSKAGVKDPQLYAAFGRAVLYRVSEFNEVEIETLAKAFTTAGHLDKPVISAMARAAEKLLNDKADALEKLDWQVCDAPVPAGCKAVCSTPKGREKVCPAGLSLAVAGNNLPPSCTLVCGIPQEKDGAGHANEAKTEPVAQQEKEQAHAQESPAAHTEDTELHA
jgi:O-acetyl-ADP-ribose deacetylase (regulator of RNase III)